MNNLKTWLVMFVLSGFALAVNAKEYVPEGGTANPTNNTSTSTTASYRADCGDAQAQTDLNINNVRARLLNGGDMWWDLNDGRYIIPNVPPGQEAVSALFAGAVWLGGFDDGGNLKLAAQTYRQTGNDYWPGPLERNSGETTNEACSRWDQHFTVHGATINEHIGAFNNDGFDCANVPDELKNWPGRGNPFFADFEGWELPNQPLAPFYDENNDGIYNPCDGDFPIIEVRGCAAGSSGATSIADQMIFWVYNDNGNIHTQTTGDPIRMEIQVQAFGYGTSDEINDMSFYRYKLINRANSPIDSTYFTMWIDGDLGCPLDDYVGSDTTRSLAVYYNENAVDGDGGCNGIASYGANPPMLGIDYFRGPLDEDSLEIGMSSFTYYINGGAGVPGMSDPQNATEYYNYMTGTWRDGSPFTIGGNGYGGADRTKYVYVQDPETTGGNSMCQQGVTGADLRTLQSSGPFRLDPGAVNELIIGVAWVPEITTYCPSFNKLLTADDLAQSLFDNCFKITNGPDAPDMDIIELDKELVLVLSNGERPGWNHNNDSLSYSEPVQPIPDNTDDTLYIFEGYKIYQVASPTVSVAELDDTEKARLIYQVDLNNGVNQIFNWVPFSDGDLPTPNTVFIPQLEVEGADEGISHSFKVTEDQFAQSNRNLVNHKKYYFLAVAYAHNSYQVFDPLTNGGQRSPYLQGRRNIGSDGSGTPYVGVPRINLPEYEGLQLNASYGDGPAITRLDGKGTGKNFLQISDETETKILENGEEDIIVYQKGAGPIDVKVVDPIRVQGGTYSLTFVDENMGNSNYDDSLKWVLTDEAGEQWFSQTTLDITVEQVILDKGISLTIGQVSDVSDDLIAPNGFIGASATYPEGGSAWYRGVPPEPISGLIATFYADVVNFDEHPSNELIDPQQVFSNVLEGSWVPYRVANWRQTGATGDILPDYITPAWMASSPTFGNLMHSSNPLTNLNNVDIVFTTDQSKWSRCPVVETANPYHQAVFIPQGGAEHMLLRKAPSIGKDGQPDGDGDGMSWFPGYAIDVETGERLNIFFGENSIYDGLQTPDIDNGNDMIWNPSSTTFSDFNGNGFPGPAEFAELVMGGQHFIYVTNTKYDNGADLRTKLNSSSASQKVNALSTIQWTSLPILSNDIQFNSMADGLVPNDARIQLRVQNPYDVTIGDGRSHPNNGYNQYEFNLDEFQPGIAVQEVAIEALDLINVVPNPYYAYSAYETRRFDNIVKVTNVPATCTITIYSLDGKFIRQYERDENPGRNTGALAEQIVTSVEWDLKNSKGIPVSAGVYLIHVDVPGVGERVIKWFGINRTFDSQDL
ncbi:MAG: hypothetical protein AB8G11_01500 [Saprospiraceae bacterium]